jgi:translation initiation factor 3 subunit H
MKIVKHCNDNLPTLVAGSLLGLDVDGILEITYSYPFPTPRGEGDDDLGEDIDGQEYQIEMMKMLRDVNVDNNCVGWYQSMYLGTSRTHDVVNNQFIYQSSEELSDNCVVVLFDPIQTKRGNLVLKAFRLSDEYVQLRKNKQTGFIKPDNILLELPVKIKNAGHISGFIRCLADSHKNEIDCKFNALSMDNSNSIAERHLELMNVISDDLLAEQQRFQQYSKVVAKPRQEQIRWLNSKIADNAIRRENGEDEVEISMSDLKPLPDAPSRLDPLLMIEQLNLYCDQLNSHTDVSLQKLLLTSKLYASSR